MKKKLAALAAFAVIFAVSAASCGKDEASETSVVLGVEQGTSASTTAATGDEESSSETTTSAKTESTTKADETETTTSAGEESTTEAETKADDAQSGNNGGDSGNNNSTNNNNNNNNSGGGQQQQPAQNNDQPQQQPEQPTQQPEQPQQQQITFSTDMLLSDASGLISKLGDPIRTSVSPACTMSGSDIKEYEFNNIIIQCYFDNGVEKIHTIAITGGDFVTDKGIKVGSSRADVEAAYGAGQEMNSMFVYAFGDKELDFTYNGDTVSKIEFYVPV